MPSSPIRAGEYATFEGYEYRASFHYYGDTALLTTIAPQSEPPGAGWTRRPNGYWTRSAPRSTLVQLYTVGTIALWKGRYAVHITAVRDEMAEFEWNPSEVGVGHAFGFSGRGPSPDHETVFKSPEGTMAGTAPLSDFLDIRQNIGEIPLVPPTREPTNEAPKKPKRGRAPRLGH